MKTRILLFVLICAGTLHAQSPGFRFGPRFGIGASQFTHMPGATSKLAVQANLVASKQLTTFFAVQFCPWTGMFGSDRQGIVQDAAPTGRARLYTYHDSYHVFSVGFPLLAKFSVPMGHNFYLSVFAGPSITFNMGGTHTKQYDDPMYNQRDGYVSHPMDDLARSMNSGIVGCGLEFETAKSIIGLDVQWNEYLPPVGQLEGTPYGARSLMVGISWIH